MLLPVRCPLCGRPGAAPCEPCADTVVAAGPGLVPALLAFEGTGRELVAALKFRNARPVAASLGRAMAARAPAVDVVTWAPTSAARRRRRGVDQAELLARATASHLGRPVRGLLVRRSGGHQTGRRRVERLLDAPVFEARCSVRGAVLVVDDVVTTGATLEAARRALLRAGASEVHLLAAAAKR